MAKFLTKDKAYSPALWVDYDPSADVLYISLGKPVPAEGEYIDGIIYRYAMKDDSPCGATIVSYRRDGWNKKQNELAKLVAKHLSIKEKDVVQAISEKVPS